MLETLSSFREMLGLGPWFRVTADRHGVVSTMFRRPVAFDRRLSLRNRQRQSLPILRRQARITREETAGCPGDEPSYVSVETGLTTRSMV